MSLEEQLIASTAVANYRSKRTAAEGVTAPPAASKGQSMDKITFETNVPQTIALKFAAGKRVESRYNDYEMFYTLTDGRVMYATPALADKIAALEPQPGDCITITKAEVRDGNRKRIEWRVVAADTAPPAQKPAQEPAPAPRAVVPAPATAAAPAPVPASGTMTQIMGGALIAAIDSLAAAERYANEKHGWKLEFGAEDVRTAANAVFIQFWKDRETRARYPQTAPARVNGGAEWQQ